MTTQANAAFAGTAYAKIYWIGAIGPHWKYGEKDQDDDEQGLVPLIDWHDTTHDAASYADRQKLAASVYAL